MKSRFAAVFALTLPLILAPPALAQEFRGAIGGSITDPAGSPVAGATIIASETRTGVKTQTVSDATGQYTIPFLAPGDYAVAASMQGFKVASRSVFHLGSGEHPAIDFRLEVGDLTQSVEVSADAPLLVSENASFGQAITTKEVEDLPLNGRTPVMLAQLATGVMVSSFNSTSTLVHPYDTTNNFSIAGTPQQTSEMLLDGSPNATWDMRNAYSPPQDAVQEVRVKAFDADAAFGHTFGGTINQVLKTGTNLLHGTAYEFTQPSLLTANNFFNNKAGLGNPVTHFNQYGLTAGGPVWIPKVLNGKNKVFWFFAWENEKDSQPNPNFSTVPTDAERQGNFAQILSADGTQLYDPFSAVQTGSTITRSPYPGNQIPTARFNPIALNYLKYIPGPNVSNGAKADGFDNFGSNATTDDDYNTFMGRLDYNMSSRSRMSVFVHETGYNQLKNDYYNNISQGVALYRDNLGGSIDEVFTINPSNVLDVRVNFTRMHEGHAQPSAGFDPTQLGFPANIAALSPNLLMPSIGFATNSGFATLSDTGANRYPSQSIQLYSSWSKIKGNHILKFGVDARQYRLNTISFGSSASSYSFSANSWIRAGSSASSTVSLGQDFAEFLLGLPTSGTYDLNTFASFYSYYTSGFVQDDWRVTHTLTVNLGVRYDRDGPYNEKYGRTVDGFAYDATNPISAAATAAYAKSPSTYLPVSAFNVRGGLTFATPSNHAVFQNTSHLASPRVGIAWSPGHFHGHTVIRGGFGLFVAPITMAQLGPNGNYSSNPLLDQEGFSQSTAMTVTNNNYLTPAATLSDPFPTGLLQPAGSSLGLATFGGQSITFMNPRMKNPYSVRWNFGAQQRLSANTMLEVVYIGNHVVHLPVEFTQMNGLPRQYMSTLGIRDPNQSYLTGSTPNPFTGLVTSGLTGTTISTAQLLSPYPEFATGESSTGWTGSGGILQQNLNAGSSYFHSLNVHLEKRLSGGLFATANFIVSKLMEQDDWLADSNPRPEKRISVMDRGQRLVTALSYELPIGSGKAVNIRPRLANTLLGGWHLTGIYTLQSGAPISWINGSSTTPGDYVYLGTPLNMNPRKVDGVAFNTAAFDTASADAFNYHIRTFSTAFGNVRQDGINNFDSSLLKRFQIKESVYMQLRFEAFNVFNHASFAAPNNTANNSAFGTITATSNRPRAIQMGARIVF